MNLLNELMHLFRLSKQIDIVDNLMNVECHYQINSDKVPSINEIIDFLKKFPARDVVNLEFSNVSGDSIVLTNQKAETDNRYNTFIEENSDPEYLIEVHLKISKSKESKKVSIYSFESFSKNLIKKDIYTIMKFFSEILNMHQEIVFINYDNNYNFLTKTITMLNEDIDLETEEYNRSEKIEKFKEVSNFLHMGEYKLIPEDFYFQRVYLNSQMKELFSKLKIILSLVYLSNIATFQDDELHLKLNGYKNRDYIIMLNKFEYKENYEELFNIYYWCVNDGNIADKMSLARNIISIHCKYSDILDIDKKTLASIKSNYDLYLKENVKQYIDLKNKAIEFINKSIKESSEIIIDFVNNLKKNIATFLTFIIGTILANIISEGNLDNIFTDDIVAICCWILLGSFVYLYISLREVDFKISIYKKEYIQLKDSYKDFLDENDINDIFCNDKAYIEIRTENVDDFINSQNS